jgi:hypothetical protein
MKGMKGARFLILAAFLAHGLALGELFSLLEGLELSGSLAGTLGWIRAAATAAVLSFSSASLARHVAEHRSRGLPVLLWFAESILLVLLISPLLVLQLRQSPLMEVIPTPAGQWLVCVAAVLAIEVSVAGGMYCKVHQDERDAPRVAPQTIDDETLIQEALEAARLARGESLERGESREGRESPERVKGAESPESPESPERGERVKSDGVKSERSARGESPERMKSDAVKSERSARGESVERMKSRRFRKDPENVYRQVVTLLRQGATGARTAKELGISPATVSRWRKRAMEMGELS